MIQGTDGSVSVNGYTFVVSEGDPPPPKTEGQKLMEFQRKQRRRKREASGKPIEVKLPF